MRGVGKSKAAFGSVSRRNVRLAAGCKCMDPKEQGGRFNILDGAALVMGSAIASLHVLRVMRSGLSIAGWTFVFFVAMIVAAIALIRHD